MKQQHLVCEMLRAGPSTPSGRIAKRRMLMFFMFCTYVVVFQMILFKSLSLLKEKLYVIHDVMRSSLSSIGVTSMIHLRGVVPVLDDGKQHSDVVCTMVNADDDIYIEEWLDYNIALGFETIYLYVNDDFFYFNEKINSVHPTYYKNHVKVIHYPGNSMKLSAYNHCVNQIIEENKKVTTATTTDEIEKANDSNNNNMTPAPPISKPTTWVACLDIDEFIVLKKKHHTTIIDFLIEYCPSGAVPLKRILFGPHTTAVTNTDNNSNNSKNNNKLSIPYNEFSIFPITKRNLFRQAPRSDDDDETQQQQPPSKNTNDQVKAIVKISDFMNDDSEEIFFHSPSPHLLLPILRNDSKQHDDTHLKQFDDDQNVHWDTLPIDVAVLHHYHYKSHKEDLQAQQTRREEEEEQVDINDTTTIISSDRRYTNIINYSVYDDSAWVFLKEKVPKYVVFDSWYN